MFDVACPPRSEHRGSIAYSRWASLELAATVRPAEAARRVIVREGMYDYAPTPGPGARDGAIGIDWHVNFADRQLFLAYGSGLFAQDEPGASATATEGDPRRHRRSW